MRRVVVFGVAAVVAGACSSDSVRSPAQPETITLPVQITSAQHAGVPHNHSVHLSGDQEVFTGPPPTPADSNAQGQAIFHIAVDGQSIDYKLIVSNIENITQAHIHCAPAGVNGPVVVWLYPSPSATSVQLIAGRHDGVLAEGTISATVDPPATNHVTPTTNPNCPGGIASLADVIERIREGNAYVNVHTTMFPGGEVRGQFKSR